MQLIKNSETGSYTIKLNNGASIGNIFKAGKKYQVIIPKNGNLDHDFYFTANNFVDARRVVVRAVFRYELE